MFVHNFINKIDTQFEHDYFTTKKIKFVFVFNFDVIFKFEFINIYLK